MLATARTPERAGLPATAVTKALAVTPAQATASGMIS
jgi:hypothetical protein